MAITENIVKGKKYRVCIDADKNEWDRVSMWTAASDVELESGDSVETALNSLNENLTASDNLQFKFGKDGDGNYGYYGADGSLIPFKSGVCYRKKLGTSLLYKDSTYDVRNIEGWENFTINNFYMIVKGLNDPDAGKTISGCPTLTDFSYKDGILYIGHCWLDHHNHYQNPTVDIYLLYGCDIVEAD